MKNMFLISRIKLTITEKEYLKKTLLSQYVFPFLICKITLKNLLSTINQSFQDFEIIIIVNGVSVDETENIIKRFQSNDKRIKFLTHTKKLGVFRSRIETIFNSRSE